MKKTMIPMTLLMVSSVFVLFGHTMMMDFHCPKDAEPVKGYVVANKKYSELDMDVSTIIDSYNIDFVILDTPNEDEIREMFLRLQNGTTLKAQENAMQCRVV